MDRDAFERLPTLDASDRVRRFAEAAMYGDDSLEAVLNGTTADPPHTPGGSTLNWSEAYLKSIRVEGFRGIGPPRKLDLVPGPGLTLVVGANGSGKSSFAEALELTLTGRTARWDSGRQPSAWRNVHRAQAAAVSTELVVSEPASSSVIVKCTWDAQEDNLYPLARTAMTTDAAGERSDVDLTTLGWEEAVELYRPFLPYSELGSMIDANPSVLHDALSAVLGLEDLTESIAMLQAARRKRTGAWQEVMTDAESLAEDLRNVDDARAQQAAKALTGKEPSFHELEQLASGSSDPDRSVESLRQFLALQPPDPSRTEQLAEDLDDAHAATVELAGSAGAEDLQIADLLAETLQMHDRHGESDCPVCKIGRLDQAWVQAARQREGELRAGAAKAEASRQAMANAERELQGLITGSRFTITAEHERLEGLGDAIEELSEATKFWGEVPDADPADRAIQLLEAADGLSTALTSLQAQARAMLEARQDVWRPFAVKIATWLAAAEPAYLEEETCKDLKAAETLLSGLLAELREKRWEPIAERSLEVWAQLRQHSSVNLDSVALAGQKNRRKVVLSASIDQTPDTVDALGVMSQGELHALSMSLFVPRATLRESPFRFVVLDDPVQSMDPSRVDGLARVLESVAENRQVVVFTHDDRLQHSLRQLGIPARVLEVSRGAGSEVHIEKGEPPWKRNIDDARALAYSDKVHESVLLTAVPTFCRLALEAACHDIFRVRELKKGATNTDVEATWSRASTLRARLGLAIDRDGTDVKPYLHNKFKGRDVDAEAALRACNDGAHGNFAGDPKGLVRDVEKLIEVLSGTRRR